MNFAYVSTAVNEWVVTADMNQLINAVLEKVDVTNINSEKKKNKK